MSLATLIRDMANAGATPEAIALAVEAIEAVQTAEADRKAKRAKQKADERERKRLSRDNDATVARHDCDRGATPPSLKDPQRELISVEVNQNPPPYSPPAPKNSRGSRIAADWQPSERNRADALGLGVPPAMVDPIGRRFRDFWTAKPGKDAVKLDWDATWRNWCSSECERKGWAPSSPSQPGHDPPRGIPISPEIDGEAWDAWREYRGGKSLPMDKDGVWFVPSRLPPSHTEAA